MTVKTTPLVGTFCWPELCSADAAASKKFYSTLLGWDFNDLHMPEGDFTIFKFEGQNVGAMYEMKRERSQAGVRPHWNSYIAVANADETVKKAVTLAGKVLMQPFDAGDDRMANLQDPTGVNFSLWEARKQSEAIRLDEVGSLCWTELYTRDPGKALVFYSGLFGWRPEPFANSPKPYTIFKHAEEARMVGGMLALTEEMEVMKPQWLPYFQVNDVDKSADRASTLGSRICHPPMDIPTVGRMAILGDPQGAMFAIIKRG